MADQVPDGIRLSQALSAASAECAKLNNIPALDQGVALHVAIDQLRRQVDLM